MPTPTGTTYTIHYFKCRVRRHDTIDCNLKTVEIHASSEQKAVSILRKRWKTPRQTIVAVYYGDYELPKTFWD